MSNDLRRAIDGVADRFRSVQVHGGLAFCWGDNSLGQLGDGTTGSTAEPTAVSGVIRFANLSPGYLHTCGVAVAGIAYCWGDNNGGELGNGSTSPSRVPVKVAGQP